MLARQLRIYAGHPRNVAPRPCEAGHQARPHWICSRQHNNGNRLRRGLGRLGYRCGRHDDAVHLQADQLRCQGGEAVHLAGRPAVLNGDILALYPAEFAQPLLEGLIFRRGAGAQRQVADPRHLRWLLRVRSERPGHYEPEQTEERASFHSITSSAARAASAARRGRAPWRS